MYVALAYTYVEYAEYAQNSSETSDTDDDENHNTWNALLEVLTTEPAGLGGMQGGIIVPFCAGHSVHVHEMVSRGATAARPGSLRVWYNM